MFWRSPLCDFILLLMLFSIAKTYVFERNLSDYEKRYIQHSNCWIRYMVVLVIFIIVLYAVGADIGIANEGYYIHSLILGSLVIYASGLWFIYVDYRYGLKEHSFRENVKLRMQAAVALPCIFLLMYFFA